MQIQETAAVQKYEIPFRANQGSVFFPTRLISPAEAKTAFEHHPSEAGSWTSAKWLLCGDARSELFDMLKAEFRNAIAVRLSTYCTPAGGNYAVISHQLFGCAHRFVLPLYESKVQAMLLELHKTGELAFLFGNERGKDAALVRSPLSRAAFAPLLAMTNPHPKQPLHRAINELLLVINAMNRPKQVPSLRRGEKVEDVTVSIVLPTQAMVQLCSEKSR